MSDGWGPDLLGRAFERRTLPLGEIDGRAREATLVRHRRPVWHAATGPLHDIDVLYVHGWSDYFFQTALADAWAALGARFFALDLHGYGRSLRPDDIPGYVTNLDEYDADIAAALAVIGHPVIEPAAPGIHPGHRRLVLMGHSTGGLTLTLWSARHPGFASALVLNSPWLELQTGALGREMLSPLVQARARYDPLGQHPVVDYGYYTRAQRELGTLPDSPDGWRPERGFPTHPGWLAAIVAGHAKIAAGVEVGAPALVMLSTATTTPTRWVPTMTASDSVLAVDDIARQALRIGREVTVGRIPGGIHDLFLSAPAPRAAAVDLMQRWSRGALTR